jgi:long-chain acyl-CoA synthetase|tara:strand:- start:3076 stop:4677 length:1602 start_codon:yes stop_codon:yes gene_type:complete
MAMNKFIKQELLKIAPKDENSLIDFFDNSLKEHKDKPAYKCLGQTISYEDIDTLSAQFAAYLINECHLKKGDRVAIQLPNLIQYPIVAWGIIRAGLIVVNTNPLYTERELLHQFNDAGVSVLIVLADFLPLIERVAPKTSIKHIISTNAIDMLNRQPLPANSCKNIISLHEALILGEGQALPHVECDLDDVVVLQYTGGTTGLSKGVMLTHANLIGSAVIITVSFGSDLSLPETCIAPMPLYHIYGFNINITSGFKNGILSILIPNARDTDSLIKVMKANQFTSFYGVNTLFVSLMQHPEFNEIDFSMMNKVIAGGAPLVDEIATEWKERTGCEIYEGYGLSETTAAATVNTLMSRELGTVGPAMISTEIKITDTKGNKVSAGMKGELVMRGPQVMIGYWKQPDATAAVLDDDGWLRTGDIAIMQENGHIKIVDRINDMILVSGFNVFPTEIENVVYSLPGILECAAVGITDPKSGEAVQLFVVVSDPVLTEDSIKDHCRSQLAAYKIPKQVVFKDELPKSNVGKILRRELRV